MKDALKEIFSDRNGKLSSKRTAFPISFISTLSLIIMQGTGFFENDISSIIQTMLILTFALLGVSLAERRNK